MTRAKVEDRRFFYSWEKKEILAKSKGRCAHCGKKIVIGDNFTIEHVIPVSKGGSNEISNLVGLCSECNTDKNNYVMVPSEYYRYVDNVYLEELLLNYDKYCKKIDWFTPTNIFKEDRFLLTSEYPMKGRSSKSGAPLFLKTKTEFRKAIYSDLDSLYTFMKAYFLRLGHEFLDLKERISDYFMNGCIYYSRNKKGEFSIVFFIKIDAKPSLKNSEEMFNYLSATVFVNGSENNKHSLGYYFSMLLVNLCARVCSNINLKERCSFAVVFSHFKPDKYVAEIMSLLTEIVLPLQDSADYGNSDFYTCEVLYGNKLGMESLNKIPSGNVNELTEELNFQKKVGSEFLGECLSRWNKYSCVNQ